MRSECDFSCLVHILSANSEFFRFDTFVYVHEIYALNSDDSIPDISLGFFYFFNFHHSLLIPGYCFSIIPLPILCPLLIFSEVKHWNFSLLSPGIISTTVPFFNTLVVA